MATNRALNKTTACKDFYQSNNTYASDKAVDGNVSTYYMSATGIGSWWSVDLENAYAINGVKITWKSNYTPTDYDVQYSDNNTDWTTWIKRTYPKSTDRVDEFKTTPNGSHRYWRIYTNKYVTQVNSAITEIEFYDDSSYVNPNLTNLIDIGFNKPVVASGQYQTYDPDHINDGDTGSAWASNTSGDVWIYFDLADAIYGDEYKIDKAHIVWEARKTVSIQYSDNSTEWTNAVTNHLGATNDEVVEWTQDTAHRYWRFSMGANYSNISTLELFTSNPPTLRGKRKFAFIM